MKFIQVAYRLKYAVLRRIKSGVSREKVMAHNGVRACVAFPAYYSVWDWENSFTFLNEIHDLRNKEDWNAFGVKKLWLYNLHYFDCLRQGDVDGEKVRLGVELMLRWIGDNPVGGGNGWEPYPISLRVVNWIKFLLRFENEKCEGVVLDSLVLQVRWLMKRLEYHLLANHLLANAKALVFAGCFFAGDEAEEWYAKGMKIYRNQLPEQVLDDGVHFELSAMYHSIILEDVLDCLNLLSGVKQASADVELFRGYAEKMVTGLRLLVGPDGKIIKFNDAAEGIALQPEVLFAYARRLGIGENKEKQSARVSGFIRQEVGTYCMVAKGAEIGPKYQPGHAHADSFSFELWRDGVKIITDTGTDRYVVDEERKRQRGSLAHNVVVVDGQNSSEVWAGHRVGRRFNVRKHQRYFDLREDGLYGRDVLYGKGEHLVEVCFHISQGGQVGTEVTSGEYVFDKCIENAWLCEEFGKQIMGSCVLYRAKVVFPIEIKWRVW